MKLATAVASNLFHGNLNLLNEAQIDMHSLVIPSFGLEMMPGIRSRLLVRLRVLLSLELIAFAASNGVSNQLASMERPRLQSPFMIRAFALFIHVSPRLMTSTSTIREDT